MENWGKDESYTQPFYRLLHLVRADVKVKSQAFQQVCAAIATASRPIPMLCNYYTCSSCYKGRERAYVESLYPISSSAAVIYYPAIDIWIYSDAVSSQRNCKIGYLLWSFS